MENSDLTMLTNLGHSDAIVEETAVTPSPSTNPTSSAISSPLGKPRGIPFLDLPRLISRELRMRVWNKTLRLPQFDILLEPLKVTSIKKNTIEQIDSTHKNKLRRQRVSSTSAVDSDATEPACASSSDSSESDNEEYSSTTTAESCIIEDNHIFNCTDDDDYEPDEKRPRREQRRIITRSAKSQAALKRKGKGKRSTFIRTRSGKKRRNVISSSSEDELGHASVRSPQPPSHKRRRARARLIPQESIVRRNQIKYDRRYKKKHNIEVESCGSEISDSDKDDPDYSISDQEVTFCKKRSKKPKSGSRIKTEVDETIVEDVTEFKRGDSGDESLDTSDTLPIDFMEPSEELPSSPMNVLKELNVSSKSNVNSLESADLEPAVETPPHCADHGSMNSRVDEAISDSGNPPVLLKQTGEIELREYAHISNGANSPPPPVLSLENTYAEIIPETVSSNMTTEKDINVRQPVQLLQGPVTFYNTLPRGSITLDLPALGQPQTPSRTRSISGDMNSLKSFPTRQVVSSPSQLQYTGSQNATIQSSLSTTIPDINVQPMPPLRNELIQETAPANLPNTRNLTPEVQIPEPLATSSELPSPKLQHTMTLSEGVSNPVLLVTTFSKTLSADTLAELNNLGTTVDVVVPTIFIPSPAPEIQVAASPVLQHDSCSQAPQNNFPVDPPSPVPEERSENLQETRDVISPLPEIIGEVNNKVCPICLQTVHCSILEVHGRNWHARTDLGPFFSFACFLCQPEEPFQTFSTFVDHVEVRHREILTNAFVTTVPSVKKTTDINLGPCSIPSFNAVAFRDHLNSIISAEESQNESYAPPRSRGRPKVQPENPIFSNMTLLDSTQPNAHNSVVKAMVSRVALASICKKYFVDSLSRLEFPARDLTTEMVLVIRNEFNLALNRIFIQHQTAPVDQDQQVKELKDEVYRIMEKVVTAQRRRWSDPPIHTSRTPGTQVQPPPVPLPTSSVTATRLSCPYCSYSTTGIQTLELHAQIHKVDVYFTGTRETFKMFPCDHPQCLTRFASLGQFLNHRAAGTHSISNNSAHIIPIPTINAGAGCGGVIREIPTVNATTPELVARLISTNPQITVFRHEPSLPSLLIPIQQPHPAPNNHPFLCPATCDTDVATRTERRQASDVGFRFPAVNALNPSTSEEVHRSVPNNVSELQAPLDFTIQNGSVAGEQKKGPVDEDDDDSDADSYFCDSCKVDFQTAKEATNHLIEVHGATRLHYFNK